MTFRSKCRRGSLRKSELVTKFSQDTNLTTLFPFEILSLRVQRELGLGHSALLPARSLAESGFPRPLALRSDAASLEQSDQHFTALERVTRSAARRQRRAPLDPTTVRCRPWELCASPRLSQETETALQVTTTKADGRTRSHTYQT